MSETNGNSAQQIPTWADADYRGVQNGSVKATDRLSLHFYRREFDCKDGTPYPDEWRERLFRLVMILEAARFHVGVPMAVLSGFRTDDHNRYVGGAPHSQHLLGRAADVRPLVHVPSTRKPDEARANVLRGLHEWLAVESQTLTIGGLGYYPSHGFIHIDIRDRPVDDLRLRRWIG